jgi:hypothetical protein
MKFFQIFELVDFSNFSTNSKNFNLFEFIVKLRVIYGFIFLNFFLKIFNGFVFEQNRIESGSRAHLTKKSKWARVYSLYHLNFFKIGVFWKKLKKRGVKIFSRCNFFFY